VLPNRWFIATRSRDLSAERGERERGTSGYSQWQRSLLVDVHAVCHSPCLGDTIWAMKSAGYGSGLVWAEPSRQFPTFENWAVQARPYVTLSTLGVGGGGGGAGEAMALAM
jgi:hypothetical protein